MVSVEFLVTSLVVVLIPGTGILYTLSTALLLGGRASIFAVIGCTFGILPSLLASILGLALIIHTSALAFQIVKYLGVAYLLYLAWAMWRSSGALSVHKESGSKSMFAVAMKGFLINILNPKLTIFFLAFLPQFIPAHVTDPTLNMLFLGGIFTGMTLVVFILYGLLATVVRDYLIHSERVAKYTQRVFASCFALLGLKLALTER